MAVEKEDQRKFFIVFFRNFLYRSSILQFFIDNKLVSRQNFLNTIKEVNFEHFLISVRFYEDEQSFIISNDGSKKGPGYMSAYEASAGYGDDISYIVGAHHLVQYKFSPFIWKNSLFLVTTNGNIYRLKNEGKLN